MTCSVTRTLGDIDVPLVLPSVDIGNGCVHVLKSQYHGEFVRDQNVRVSDAVPGIVLSADVF